MQHMHSEHVKFTEPLGLTQSESLQYAEQGFFVRPAVFDEAELPQLRQAVEHAANRAAAEVATGHTYFLDGKRFVDTASCTVQFEHKRDCQDIRVIEPVHNLHPALDALVDDPRLVNPMRGLLGDTLSLWTAKLNLKRPGGSGFGWHQDSPYWMHDCKHVDLLPNVMLALDEQRLDNGCFEVINGSHRQGILPGTADGTQLGGFYTDPAAFAEDARTPLTGPAGSLFFFSPHSVHGSMPNQSSTPRRALILTYQPGHRPMLKLPGVRPVRTAG